MGRVLDRLSARYDRENRMGHLRDIEVDAQEGVLMALGVLSLESQTIMLPDKWKTIVGQTHFEGAVQEAAMVLNRGRLPHIQKLVYPGGYKVYERL